MVNRNAWRERGYTIRLMDGAAVFCISRYTTIHCHNDNRGVLVQPVLVADPDSLMLIYNYTVSGNPIVKKNTQKVVRNGNRSFVVYSAQYREWLHRAMDELALQDRPPEPINYPVILVCKFFMQTKRVVDLSALYEGIQDTLVKMDILADDNFNIVAGHDGSRVLLARQAPRTEVTIIPYRGGRSLNVHSPAPAAEAVLTP